jgi:methylphosphotriester-DNA--protein-cysteine methyltransferase
MTASIAMDSNITALVVLQATTILTLIVKAGIDGIRSMANRRRQLKDRALDLIERQTVADAVHLAADRLADTVELHQQTVSRQIQQNTQLTIDNGQRTERVGEKAEAAYREANTVNLKLAAIGVQIKNSLHAPVEIEIVAPPSEHQP